MLTNIKNSIISMFSKDKGRGKVVKTTNKYSVSYKRNNIIHREDGPAIVHFDGTKEWFVNGLHHREDGPAIEWSDGTKLWYIKGLRHRTDGPAIEYANGDKEWHINGLLHREDAPAIENKNGFSYYINGYLHREDGPAYTAKHDDCFITEYYIKDKLHRLDGPALQIKYNDGRIEESYYMNGKLYSTLFIDLISSETSDEFKFCEFLMENYDDVHICSEQVNNKYHTRILCSNTTSKNLELLHKAWLHHPKVELIAEEILVAPAISPSQATLEAPIAPLAVDLDNNIISI